MSGKDEMDEGLSDKLIFFIEQLLGKGDQLDFNITKILYQNQIECVFVAF